MARRQHVTLTVVAGLMVFMFMTYFLSGSNSAFRSSVSYEEGSTPERLELGLTDSILKGGSIAPKLENATAK